MEINLEGMEFLLTVGDYQVTGGFTAKYMSDEEDGQDWARIMMTEELSGFLKDNPVDECRLEMGNEDGYELLLYGHGSFLSENDILIRGEATGFVAVHIAVAFVDCTLQEAARYILAVAGIEKYRLTERDYGRKQIFFIEAMSCKDAFAALNAAFGADIDYFFRDGVFYYGVDLDQEEYITLTDDNILEIEKTGNVWAAEIIPVPHIHVRQIIYVECEEFTGTGRVTKCVLEGGESIDMYINFKEVEDE